MTINELPILDIEARELYRKRYSQSTSELADASLNSRLAWNLGYQYHYFDDGQVLTAISDGGIFTRPHFCLPLGALTVENLTRAIERAAEIFQDSKFCCFCSMFIDEHYRPLYNEAAARLGYVIDWEYNDDYSDYVYDAEALRQLQGKVYRVKRNHINQFLRDFPDARYEAIAPEHGERFLRLVRQWAEEKGVDPLNLHESDYLPIKYLFDHFEALDVRGGVIRLGEIVLAFALGSLPSPKRAIIHFEKANPEFENLYAVINKWTLEEAFAEVSEVNREEDMGIEGIRLAKESYNPIKRLRKYRAFLMPQKDGRCHEACQKRS